MSYSFPTLVYGVVQNHETMSFVCPSRGGRRLSEDLRCDMPNQKTRTFGRAKQILIIIIVIYFHA